MLFVPYKSDTASVLANLHICKFSDSHSFLVEFQAMANCFLCSEIRDPAGTELIYTIDIFNRMIGLTALIKVLTPAYTCFLCDSEPHTLEEVYILISHKYVVHVEKELDQDAKLSSIWNLLLQRPMPRRKYLPSTHSQEQQVPRGGCITRSVEGYNCLFNPMCYNCKEKGHIFHNCTAKCSICSDPGHSNYDCAYNCANQHSKPQEILMSEANYDAAKCGLSSSATPQLMNK
ncbi:hypothetical protein DSO57_1010781, partial [Entomophthora muscae]